MDLYIFGWIESAKDIILVLIGEQKMMDIYAHRLGCRVYIKGDQKILRGEFLKG
jgi:hypothetical protein